MIYKYFVSAALLMATASPVAPQSVRAGIDEWQKSNYSGAVAIWRPLAEEGDADAEFNLGQAYRLGRGVPTNPAAAKIWFERAANQGNIDAETTLGLLLFQNGEQSEGLNWLKKAADQGEPRAELVYGTALVNGDSVTQDPALGYAYVRRAAESGLEAAKDTLQQLDKLLPAGSRKHGLVLARTLAKGAPTKPLTSRKAAEASGGASRAAAVSPVNEAPTGSSRNHREAKVSEAPAAQASIKTKSQTRQTPVETVSPSEKPTGRWRIQLGAFSKRSNAEALYKGLADNFAIGKRQAYYVPNGTVTRLQVGPFESRSSAETACQEIKLSCFVVPAK